MNSRIETALFDSTIYSGLFHVCPNAWLSSLLIPLNLCRRKNNYKPWDCHHERHAYEQSVDKVLLPHGTLLTRCVLCNLGASTMSASTNVLLTLFRD